MILPLADVPAPHIDYKGLSPLIALVGGTVLVLMAALLRGRFVQRSLLPLLTLGTLGAAMGLSIWVWSPGDHRPIVESALEVDALALSLSLVFYVAGIATVLLAHRSAALSDAGAGEYYTLLLSSVTGMVLLAEAANLITLFVGIELLSIPLYVLCASQVRRRASLEAGLKYLVIGSVGSATLLYGLALIYGAAGTTSFAGIDRALGDTVSLSDPLLLTGIALACAGLAFKASVAPFHQWTPDVYQGAPTPVTAFMAVATKAAAFAIFLRLFDSALLSAQFQWAPALAALATITIVVGNVGAIAQDSLKRMLAWSGVAQAGYILAGVVVGTQKGLEATVFYLLVYLLMNVAAFAVVIARERVSEWGDGMRALEGLGRAAPWLAWPMTIAMLALAGFPATAGFIGKFYLIDAAVDGDYAWLGVVIVAGSMISLVYYLRVVAVMWMGPMEVRLPSLPGRPRTAKPVGGWSPEADAWAQPEVTLVAVACAAATMFFGIWPNPLFDLVADVGTSLASLVG
ncbi:MAG: NADH-quinone oxidoreductase subunit N [Thermoleophilaceae bacterium]|nr:NADH-quinone oxidoreductase subunit N [Thermoleophilaceae bacterium]